MDKREIKSLLNSVVIKTPCSEKWESMTGDDKVRLCGQCNLNVHNLSNMTDVEAAAVLKRRKTERVCVFGYKRMDGSIVVDNCPKRLRKLRNCLRVAVVAATLTICYALGLSVQASGGLVGAGYDPAFGQVNEVGRMADVGCDTARNVSSLMTMISCVIVFFLPLDKNKRLSVSRLLLELIALALVPILVHLAGNFVINNFGGVLGGL
jgi:hypothetical protein